MAGIFKAYDIRGIYPTEINEEIVEQIGRAFAKVLDEEDRSESNTVVVSRDMREHSEAISAALIAGLQAAGLDVLDIGMATTPMNYFAVGHLKAAGGVQVTASHNPARYNGLKFSKRGARPVSGDHGIALLKSTVAAGGQVDAPTPGTLTRGEIFDTYGNNFLAFQRRPEGAKTLKVAVDAANGMGSLYEPFLRKMGIELVPLYFELDGTFPNHEANPLKAENLEDLSALVLESGADLGISFDGDADRAAFIDERGQPIGSDLTTALIGGELLAREPGKHVLFDLRSSRAVAEYIRESGGIPVRERVGHSFIKATLREKEGIFGGELAGHYYFRDAYNADSALLAVIEVINVMWRQGKPLSAIVAPLYRYAKSPEVNFEVEDKAGKIAELDERYKDGSIDYLDGITVEYPTWWFNVRPSNTEPFLRLVLEAETAEELDTRHRELCDLLGEPV